MTELELTWTKTLMSIESNFSEAVYDNYIKPLIPVSFKDNNFILMVADSFYKDILNERYMPYIVNGLRAILNTDVTVEILLQEDIDKREKTGDINHHNVVDNYYDKFVFDSFVPGKNSHIAYEAAIAVAKDPGNIYNPLFIYGGVGLGKTHLMYSIFNYIKEVFPDNKVLYCTSEEFTNEFIASIRSGSASNNDSTNKFRAKYRDVDVLLIDDIQFLIGKGGTLEELFHTFNALQAQNKQVVITSDLPPNKMENLEARVRSRFAQGLTVDISLPDFETRSAILNKKADLDGIDVPTEVVNFISQNITSNIRELEGALTRVSAFCRLNNSPITLSLAEDALRDIINKPTKQEINIPYIQQIVAEEFNITVDDIKGKKRPSNIAFARQVAMYLSCKHTDDTLTKIGKEYFGGRDHSTIHYGSKTISKEYNNNPEVKELILNLEKKLKG